MPSEPTWLCLLSKLRLQNPYRHCFAHDPPESLDRITLAQERLNSNGRRCIP